MSLYVTSTEICNTGHDPSRRFEQNSVLKIALNEPNDPKGLDNIICIMICIRTFCGTTQAAVKTYQKAWPVSEKCLDS